MKVLILALLPRCFRRARSVVDCLVARRGEGRGDKFMGKGRHCLLFSCFSVLFLPCGALYGGRDGRGSCLVVFDYLHSHIVYTYPVSLRVVARDTSFHSERYLQPNMRRSRHVALVCRNRQTAVV